MEESNQSSNATPPVSPVGQTTPIQTPPDSTSEKSKSKLPILIIGIIVFLLIAGSAAGFYVFKQQSLKTAVKPTPSPIDQEQTPTLDPTANWKTYKGEGFSFRYPDVMDNSCCTLGGPLTLTADTVFNLAEKSTVKMSTDANANAFTLFLVDRKNNDSLQSVSEKEKKALDNNIFCDGVKDMKNFVLGNQKGVQISCTNPSDTFIVQSPDGKYFLVISRRETEKGKFDVLFDQILSTFKFTDSQTVDTSNWKTYESSNGYSIKYPSGWTSGKNGLGCATGDYFYPQTEGTKSYTDIQKACPTSDSVIISIHKNAEKLTTEEYIKKSTTLGKTTAITVNGIQSIELTDSSGSVARTYVYIPKEDNIYSVTLNGGSNIISQDTFKQILSTFKFTN